jgi:murein DD-endopeptidase MepM/ murein hydrolase activator NlpD
MLDDRRMGATTGLGPRARGALLVVGGGLVAYLALGWLADDRGATSGGTAVDRVVVHGDEPAPVAALSGTAGLIPPPGPRVSTTPPPPVTLPGPAVGTVMDARAVPIARAQVLAVDAQALALGPPTLTDAAGGFWLAPDVLARTAALRIAGPGVVAAELSWIADAPAPRIVVGRQLDLVALVSRAGAVVAGARVHLRDGGDGDRAVAVTGLDGVARFEAVPAAPYELWAEGGGGVSTLVAIDASATGSALLELGPAGVIVAQVAGGSAGAQVALARRDGDHAVRRATVDATGAVAIEGLVPGTWRLEVTRPGGFAEREVEVRPGARQVVEVALAPTGSVTGVVVDDLGAPVIGATVIVQGAAGADPVAGAPSLRSSARWIHPLAGVRELPHSAGRRFGADRPGPRPAECGAGHCGVDLGHERGRSVHAVADGTLALVYPQLRGRAGRYVAIDHAGGLRTFYMHLDEVRADLVVGAPIAAGEPLGTVGTSGVYVSGPHLHFALSQALDGRTFYIDPEAMLRDAVVLPADRPLGSTVVIDDGVRVATIRADGVARTEAAATAPRGRTDARGAFVVNDLRPGAYTALALAPGLLPGQAVAARVIGGPAGAPLRLVLSVGQVIAGVVTGPDGPIAGAQVVATAVPDDDASGEAAEVVHQLAAALTGPDGRYELRAVRGTVEVRVVARGFGVSQRVVALGAGATPRREDFSLVRAAARLFAEVRDATGAPVAGVSARVVGGPTADRRAVTGLDGAFIIRDVVDGAYRLELRAPGLPTTMVELASERFATFTLRSGGALALTVLDRHTGRPLAASVRASGPGGATRNAATDALGGLALPHLPAGTWRLELRADGFVGERREVVLRDGQATPLRVELARGAVVAGFVRDYYGQRVGGARVRLGSAETTTSASGEFRLVDAPTGSRDLVVELGDRRARMPLTLAPGDERVTLVIDLVE